MKLTSYKLTIKTDRPLETQAVRLRGFIGKRFPELNLLHNHMSDSSFIYTFPRVQYHVINSNMMIIGIEEGVDAVKHIETVLSELSLNKETYLIVEKTGIEREIYYGILKDQISYSFLTPWLALNQKNYEKYQMMVTWAKRKKLLEGILVGNIISMSKSLGYTVPGPIEAKIERMREVRTSLKGTAMIGFLGTFSVNFEIPDYWGIGKSVSRGFGTVVRQGTDGRGKKEDKDPIELPHINIKTDNVW